MSFLIAGAAGAAVSLIGAGIGASQAAKAQRKAEADEKQKRLEMNRLKGVYSNLDTSNPFLNMENTMEDLTVNQQQAQMINQQGQQQRANIMGQMKGAAGGSGIAALAQQMAQSGQLASQRSAASIGSQESTNQMATARQAGYIQNKERQGEVQSRQMKKDQVGTLLGMSQQETAAARNQAAMAEQAKWSAISGGVEGVASAATSYATSGLTQ